MSANNLPPLPEPCNDGPDGPWPIFDANQMRAYALAAVEAEREKVAQWMLSNGYVTGHGDTILDLFAEFRWQAAEAEMEACAKVCEEEVCDQTEYACNTIMRIAAAIRARGNIKPDRQS